MSRHIKCDLCKEEISFIEGINVNIGCYDGDPQPIEYRKLDFCKSCYEKFIKTIQPFGGDKN